jgi:hypothetical protein
MNGKVRAAAAVALTLVAQFALGLLVNSFDIPHEWVTRVILAALTAAAAFAALAMTPATRAAGRAVAPNDEPKTRLPSARKKRRDPLSGRLLVLAGFVLLLASGVIAAGFGSGLLGDTRGSSASSVLVWVADNGWISALTPLVIGILIIRRSRARGRALAALRRGRNSSAS